jgi:hypothetical protein
LSGGEIDAQQNLVVSSPSDNEGNNGKGSAPHILPAAPPSATIAPTPKDIIKSQSKTGIVLVHGVVAVESNIGSVGKHPIPPGSTTKGFLQPLPGTPTPYQQI